MKPLEPGDEYEIEYGNGHRLTVRALNGRQKRKVAAAIYKAQSFDPSKNSPEDVYLAAEEALRAAVPDAPESLFDTTDETQQFEIAGKVLGNQSLTEDERKKSESQP